MNRRRLVTIVAVAAVMLSACAQQYVGAPAESDIETVAPASQAKNTSVDAEFGELKSRDGFDAALRTAMRESEAIITPDCSNIDGYEELVPAEKLVDETHQVYWLRYALDVCGDKKVRNYLVGIANDGTIKVALFAPGTTIASPILVRDTLLPFYVTAASMMKDDGFECEVDGQLVNTEFLEMQTTPKARWVERWTMRFCGRLYAREISFFETETGTQYVIEGRPNP